MQPSDWISEIRNSYNSIIKYRNEQKSKTMRYHYIHIRMAKIQNADNPNFGKDVEQQELPFIIGGNAKMVQQLFKSIWQFFIKLNLILL